MAQVQNEEDKRIALMNSLLQCNHRELDKVHPVHEKIVKDDPIFYRHLASYYHDNGDVRDHKESFVINLVTSPIDKNEPEIALKNREVGLALLRNLPPYQVERIIDFINGVAEYPIYQKEKIRIKNKKTGRYEEVTKTTVTKKRFGLFKNVPRSLRTEIERYLAEREADSEWFDGVVIAAKRTLKRLYQLLKIKPGERANNILFKNIMPENSRLAAIKAIAKETDPGKQAELIIANKISYKIASSIVQNMTPSVLLALVTVMTDQELMNNLGSLEKRGLFANPDLKKVVDDRLTAMKKSKKVNVLKGMVAADNTNLSEDTRAKLVDVADSQVKKSKFLAKWNTALFVDISQSMTQAIELGKQLAAARAASMADGYKFYCYAFNSVPYPLTANDTSLDSWTKAFSGLKAGGSTNCGAPFSMMIAQKVVVDQVVIITDEGEWPRPGTDAKALERCDGILNGLKKYERELGVRPSIRIIRCGNAQDMIYSKLLNEGYDVEYQEFSGDYNSIPNLLMFLNKNSKLDLLVEIMSHPLPVRKDH